MIPTDEQIIRDLAERVMGWEIREVGIGETRRALAYTSEGGVMCIWGNSVTRSRWNPGRASRAQTLRECLQLRSKINIGFSR